MLFANLLDQFIPGPPETTRWAKKWRNFAYFLTPPVPSQLSRPNAAKYRNSKKTGSPWKVALHFCQFRRTLTYKPLRSRRRFTIFFKLRFLTYISGAAEHTFAKLLPMVDLGCVQIPQYLGSCDVFPKLHGGPHNVEILHIFGTPYSHARTRQNIVILKWTY